MNPDLIITIVFSLWVLLAWGAWGVLLVRSVRNDKTEEANTKQRLDAARESREEAARADKSRRQTAALERGGGLGISAGASQQRRSRASSWCWRRQELKG